MELNDEVTLKTTWGALGDLFSVMEHPRLDQLFVEAHRADSVVSEAAAEKALEGDAFLFCKALGLGPEKALELPKEYLERQG